MNLVDGVKHLLLQPKEEWQVIDKESLDVADFYKSYIAALGGHRSAVQLHWHVGRGHVSRRDGYLPCVIRIGTGPVGAYMVLIYGLMLGGVYVIATIIDALAPTFGAQRSKSQALKLAAYASTASWLGGIFSLFPVILLKQSGAKRMPLIKAYFGTIG